MSNIKEIDGVFINLDLVFNICTFGNKSICLEFLLPSRISEWSLNLHGQVTYKTQQEAEARIRDILKMQNSPTPKI